MAILRAIFLFFAISITIVNLVSKPVFAADSKIIPQKGLSEWVENAAKTIMTFDFSNYDLKKEANRPYFTASGHASFYKAMDVSLIPETIKKDQILVESSVLCAAEVFFKQQRNWEVKLPLSVSYTSAKGIKRQFQMVTISVLYDDKSKLYGINQWIALPMTDAESSVCGSIEQKKARIGELRREIAQRQAELNKLESQLP